ncbi:MAG TPA: cytochrome P450 [Acidimicrobiales bacterium]|nr:cytochrome P450 [Acidimicrobiales bacterium]
MTDHALQVPFGDPAFFAGDPDPEFAELRRGCPVSWQQESDLWAVTGLREIQTVGKDPATFCSGQGVLLSDRGREIAAEDSLLYLDPPRHEQYRKLVNRAFTPRRVATLEPRVRELTVELLDNIDPHQPVDMVDSLCAPLPMLVIAELLGLPAKDRDNFRRWSDAIMEAATDLTEENALQALELMAYFDVQLDARVGAPTEDLLSGLLAAEVDGTRLTRAEVQGFCMTLMVAGNETTRSLVSGGMVELARHPDQRARLAHDPRLIPPAVEEMLRWVTPIMAMARTTTRDVTLGEVDLGVGEFVVLAYGAANRDEVVFGETADVFDISRTPNPHVSFGFGEHFCIGASLARLEARVLLEEVLARWPDYELAGEVVRAPSTLFRQITRAPVLFAR